LESGAIDLILSDAFLSNIDLKLDESQVQTSIDTKLAGYQAKLISNSTDGRNLLRPDGVTLLALEEEQFIKITPTFALINNVPTNFRLKIGITNEFANQVIDATNNIATLQTNLLGILTPSTLNITSDTWPQITLKSNSNTDYIPCEITFDRQILNTVLKATIGVAGDTARGAYWWAGGEDRINISCTTGTVKIRSMLTSPVIQSDTIRANTANEITIDDNMIINNNLTVNGTITASNSNPFWTAGRFSGSNLNKVDSVGRYDFNVERVSGFAAGVYRITFTTAHAKGGSYITNATASAVQCGVMNDAGYTPTAAAVIVYSRANTGALVDSEMNFMVLA
jgi:hypothetical protein